MKMIPKSNALKIAYETALDMHKAKLITDEELEQYEKDCLMPVVPRFIGQQIKDLRKHLQVSQDTLARALNVSLSSVRQWEQNQKDPSGASCKLLDLINRKGINFLY